MKILGIDLETTGLDAEKNHITEIGACLWDVEKKSPLAILSTLVQTDHEITQEITALTGITSEDVHSPFAMPIGGALVELGFLFDHADYWCAHNAKFDRGFIEKAQKNNRNVFKDKHWIDTRTDLPFPDSISSRKLEFLCCQHGFLNPFSHRAIFDTMAMLKMLSMYNWADILTLSNSPLLKIMAKVTYQDRQLAKDAGFHWEGDSKQWHMDIKALHYDPKKYDFKTEIIEENKIGS